MSEALIALLSVFGTAITAYVGWLIAKRRTSGTITTSSSAEIWGATKDLLSATTEQLVGTRNQLTETTAQLTHTSALLTESTAQVGTLLQRLAVSETAVTAQREDLRKSRQESAELRVIMKEVHSEVKTANALSIGKLADNQETRRISDIPEADRTAQEREHVDHVGIQSGSGPSELKGEGGRGE